MTIDEFKLNIVPYLINGYIFMDDCNKWWFTCYGTKPYYDKDVDDWVIDGLILSLEMFKIKPVDNWRGSLFEV